MSGVHVKLYAPLSWKVNVISNRNNISEEEAKKLVIKTDKRRSEFVDDFLKKVQDKVVYDIDFNCAKFTQDEIIDVILKIVEIKSLLK